MKCRFCGKEIPDHSKFCRYCGKAQEGPGPALQGESSGKQKKSGGKKPVVILLGVILAIVLVVGMVGAGAYVFLNLTQESGGSPKNTSSRKSREDADSDDEDKNDEEDGEDRQDGEKKSRGGDSILKAYLTYAGTSFKDLPDSFERNVKGETAEFSYIECQQPSSYSGIEGKIIFEGYEFKSKEFEERMKLPKEIGTVLWVPDQYDDTIEEQILDELVRSYGEYDGEVKEHTIIDRNSESPIEVYGFYYWDNPGGEDYDIQLLTSDNEERPCFISIGGCSGEKDSQYEKPLRQMEEAFANGDAKALRDVFAEEFFLYTYVEEEDLEDGIEEVEHVVVEVKNAERLPKYRRAMVLTVEYGFLGSEGKAFPDHVYILDAVLKQTVDKDTEEGEIRIITGKTEGKWKILYWEIP